MDLQDVMERNEQHYWVDTFQEIINEHDNEKYIKPEFLYTIKCAHANWDIHWEKTMYDILFFQRKNVQFLEDYYNKLLKDFKEIHGKRWASLEGKNSTTFFVDKVTRKYVHDDIHEAIAYYDEPLYERILKEKGKVGCSYKKFNTLDLQDQLKLVKEEVFVTALERYLIPSNFKYGDNRSYHNSLKKLITTMSSGWFSRFIITHYKALYRNKDWDFIVKFKQAEANGKLRKENNE